MWSGSLSTCHSNAPLTPLHPLTPPNSPYTQGPQCPLMPPIPLLALSTYTPCQPPIQPWHLLHPLMPPIASNIPTLPRSSPMPPYATYTHSSPEYLHSLPAPNTPNIPHDAPHGLQTPPRSSPCPLMPPIPLLVFNCYFATDLLHTVKMLVFYCCHFQLSSLCNWPSAWVCPVYKIPSLGVKNTSSVLWSSANFCSISQNMHYKDPVASQHWKTNKVVWIWKDDWPPWRTSTYERPFT